MYQQIDLYRLLTVPHQHCTHYYNLSLFWKSLDCVGGRAHVKTGQVSSLSLRDKKGEVTVFTLGSGVTHTTVFAWCTTWLVPGNLFVPLGLNSNCDNHSATTLISN